MADVSGNVGLGGALSLDVDKYIDLENVNLYSKLPPKKGISIWVIIAGVVLAILLFKR